MRSSSARTCLSRIATGRYDGYSLVVLSAEIANSLEPREHPAASESGAQGRPRWATSPGLGRRVGMGNPVDAVDDQPIDYRSSDTQVRSVWKDSGVAMRELIAHSAYAL